MHDWNSSGQIDPAVQFLDYMAFGKSWEAAATMRMTARPTMTEPAPA